ncbi:MAG: energy transducer TonB [Pseudomonadota bacterium]
MTSPSPPLVFGFAASLTLHALLLAARPLPYSGSAEEVPMLPKGAPAIEARLAPLVLKNTIEDSADKQTPPTVQVLPPATAGARHAAPTKVLAPRPRPRMLEGTALARAQKILADRLLYPQEAVDQGLEGEAILLLHLDGQGNIVRVEVASSSGHPILDRAALAAARHIGSLPGLAGTQTLLPVRFQLL